MKLLVCISSHGYGADYPSQEQHFYNQEIL